MGWVCVGNMCVKLRGAGCALSCMRYWMGSCCAPLGSMDGRMG